MLFRRDIYLGICAFLAAGLPVSAADTIKPPTKGYSTTAPASRYHASSNNKQKSETILPEECANTLNLAGITTARPPSGKSDVPGANLPAPKQAANKQNGRTPHLTFDMAVPLRRGQHRHPAIGLGEFSVDLNHGTTRFKPAQQGKQTNDIRC